VVGVCMNAESEIEAINKVWGAAGCGVRAMIASTGQGISLMQEAVDLVILAFHLADKWRNPVDVLGDFILGHTSEAVEFRTLDERDLPPKTWAATGARDRAAHKVTPLGAPQTLTLNLSHTYEA